MLIICSFYIELYMFKALQRYELITPLTGLIPMRKMRSK